MPSDLDDAAAVACGIAGIAGWVPVARRAPVQAGDRVLVLGATGTVGSVAVQAARVLGAERVVAAGRNPDKLERVLELGADEVVLLDGDDLEERFREACGGDGPTLDRRSALGRADPGRRRRRGAAGPCRPGRTVRRAGGDSHVGLGRGSSGLSILGHSNFGLSPADLATRTSRSPGTSPPGGSRSTSRPSPSTRSREAWAHQAAGAKAVVRALEARAPSPGPSDVDRRRATRAPGSSTCGRSCSPSARRLRPPRRGSSSPAPPRRTSAG